MQQPLPLSTAGDCVVAAHQELRTRLSYGIGVKIAQKERHAERERRQQREQLLKYSQFHPPTLHSRVDADDAAALAGTSTDAGRTPDNDVHENAGDGDRSGDDVHDDYGARADVYEDDGEGVEFQRRAAAAEVAAMDAGHKHWSKAWIAAAAAAEKGQEIVTFLHRFRFELRGHLRLIALSSLAYANCELTRMRRAECCDADGGRCGPEIFGPCISVIFITFAGDGWTGGSCGNSSSICVPFIACQCIICLVVAP